jgi:hypothetical protein
MRCRVLIDPRCELNFGARSPDRQMLIIEHVRAIINLLGSYKGHPPNSAREENLPPEYYVWEDQNWRVSYRIEDKRQRLFAKIRVITVKTIYLKNARS